MRRYGALHCAFVKQGPQTDELTPKPQRLPVCFDTLTVESGMCVVLGDESRAGCGDGLPRIACSQKWDLKTAMFTPRASYIRKVHMVTVTAKVHFVFENTSRAGCGARLPRITFSQNGTSNRLCSPPGASNIGELPLSTVTVYACLMFANASKVGCGGKAPCIAYSQNRALPAGTPPGLPM